MKDSNRKLCGARPSRLVATLVKKRQNQKKIEGPCSDTGQ